jgi:hypothetical protein
VKWKIVLVDARPFPEDLKEPLPAEGRAINWPAMAIGIFVIALCEISRRLIRNPSHGKNLS